MNFRFFRDIDINVTFGWTRFNKVFDHHEGPVKALTRALEFLGPEADAPIEPPDGEADIARGHFRQPFFYRALFSIQRRLSRLVERSVTVQGGRNDTHS